MTLRPRVVLAVFCAGIVVYAFLQPWHVTESVDVRTYVEMMRGISLHGLPYLDNGPVDRFPALQVPWNIEHEGRYWGIYAPAYPYYGALFVSHGLRAVGIATFTLLVPLVLATFALARKVMHGDEWWALVSSVFVVVSTPLLGKALDLSPFVLATTFVVLTSLSAISTIDGRHRVRWAFATGVFAALGIASHIVTAPIAVATIGLLAVVDGSEAPRAPSFLARTIVRTLWPTRRTLANAGVASLGLLIALAPVALLNHTRFGSFNPLSYGPTPWKGVGGVVGMTIGGHLRDALPCIALFVPIVLGIVLASAIEEPRRRWLVSTGVIAVAMLVLVASPLVRERSLQYATAARAFIVDVSLLEELVPPHRRLPSVVGTVMGPWVVKSTLQCTPILILALLSVRHGARTVMLVVPAAALYVYLALRANLGLAAGLGYPWVYIRYTLPALPLLLVAALTVVREITPKPRDVVIAALAALALTVFLLQDTRDDEERAAIRHLVLLVLPLLLALAASVTVILFRRERASRSIVATVIALTCASGIGAAIGHDLSCNRQGKAYCQWKLDSVADQLPQRFALFGHPESMDIVLALRATRDVQYAQLAQVDNDPAKMRLLVEYWFAEDRPIYFVTDQRHATSMWPDLSLEPVNEDHGLYRLVRP